MNKGDSRNLLLNVHLRWLLSLPLLEAKAILNFSYHGDNELHTFKNAMTTLKEKEAAKTDDSKSVSKK